MRAAASSSPSGAVLLRERAIPESLFNATDTVLSSDACNSLRVAAIRIVVASLIKLFAIRLRGSVSGMYQYKLVTAARSMQGGLDSACEISDSLASNEGLSRIMGDGLHRIGKHRLESSKRLRKN